jgi:N-methylhydantoinase B
VDVTEARRSPARGQTMSPSFDPVRFEVVRGGLVAVVEEMSIALQRAAYSTNVKTRQDFSCAVFDAELRMVAQSFSVPMHLGSMTCAIPAIVRRYGPDRLQEGQIVVCNDGYRSGCVHLNDVVLVAPFFSGGRRVGFVTALAHHVDVGGANPGSIGLAREIFAEGLLIPPTLLVHDGQVDENVLGLILNNVRSPTETGGDLRAQIAGINIGMRRLGELVSRHGLAPLLETMSQLLDYTERRAKHALAQMPRGTYSAEGWMDNDGIGDEPVRVAVTITLDGEQAVFDLNGSSPQQLGPINSTYAMTLSNCAYALRCVLDDPDLPTNDGFYRAVEVVAPLGSVVNATDPAPIGAGWETGFRVSETALYAFGLALPERITAGSKGCLSNITFGGLDPRTGKYFAFFDSMAGGYGARAAKDGIDAIQPHGQNTENSPVEETEANYPVRIVRYELVPDSEGAGRNRGGLGLRRDYTFEGETAFGVMADRVKFPPWGYAGGEPAMAAQFVRNPGTSPEPYPSKFATRLSPGEVIRVQMGGGGGYGRPFDRDPQQVLADVVQGKISPSRARDAYGVVINSAGDGVELEATQDKRATRQPLRVVD